MVFLICVFVIAIVILFRSFSLMFILCALALGPVVSDNLLSLKQEQQWFCWFLLFVLWLFVYFLVCLVCLFVCLVGRSVCCSCCGCCCCCCCCCCHWSWSWRCCCYYGCVCVMCAGLLQSLPRPPRWWSGVWCLVSIRWWHWSCHWAVDDSAAHHQIQKERQQKQAGEGAEDDSGNYCSSGSGAVRFHSSPRGSRGQRVRKA